MINFQDTHYARALFEQQIPAAIKQLTRIADALEAQNAVKVQPAEKAELPVIHHPEHHAVQMLIKLGMDVDAYTYVSMSAVLNADGTITPGVRPITLTTYDTYYTERQLRDVNHYGLLKRGNVPKTTCSFSTYNDAIQHVLNVYSVDGPVQISDMKHSEAVDHLVRGLTFDYIAYSGV